MNPTVSPEIRTSRVSKCSPRRKHHLLNPAWWKQMILTSQMQLSQMAWQHLYLKSQTARKNRLKTSNETSCRAWRPALNPPSKRLAWRTLQQRNRQASYPLASCLLMASSRSWARSWTRSKHPGYRAFRSPFPPSGRSSPAAWNRHPKHSTVSCRYPACPKSHCRFHPKRTFRQKISCPSSSALLLNLPVTYYTHLEAKRYWYGMSLSRCKTTTPPDLVNTLLRPDPIALFRMGRQPLPPSCTQIGVQPPDARSCKSANRKNCNPVRGF